MLVKLSVNLWVVEVEGYLHVFGEITKLNGLKTWNKIATFVCVQAMRCLNLRQLELVTLKFSSCLLKHGKLNTEIVHEMKA